MNAPVSASLQREAKALLRRAIEREMRSGYDEQIGLGALYGVSSLLEGSHAALSAPQYTLEVLAAILARMQALDARASEGQYSSGSSTLGSYAMDFADAARRAGVGVTLDVRDARLEVAGT